MPCGLSCFGTDAQEIVQNEKQTKKRKRLSMWNGELDDPAERPTSKSRLTPEELHRMPSDDTLDDIAKVVLLDRNRNKVTLKELVNDGTHRRTIVIFIRHFFCGVSLS